MILAVQGLLGRRVVGMRMTIAMRVAIGVGVTVAIAALRCGRTHSGRICMCLGEDPS